MLFSLACKGSHSAISVFVSMKRDVDEKFVIVSSAIGSATSTKIRPTLEAFSSTNFFVGSINPVWVIIVGPFCKTKLKLKRPFRQVAL